MVNRIVLNTVSYHGSGAVKEIGPELSARGFRKALICSGKHVVKSGEINKILDPLKEAGIDAALFTDIKANPTIENVQNGVKAFQNAQADCIIAVGGGSVHGYRQGHRHHHQQPGIRRRPQPGRASPPRSVTLSLPSPSPPPPALPLRSPSTTSSPMWRKSASSSVWTPTTSPRSPWSTRI